MKPSPIKGSLKAAFAGVAISLVPATGLAQSLLDFPTFQGTAGRAGHSGDPLATGSGQSNLRWYYGGVDGLLGPIVNDNYPVAEPVGTEVKQYWNRRSNAWFGPGIDDEAPFAYTIYDPANPDNIYRPAYLYSRCVPVRRGSNDPTVAETAGSRQFFEWAFKPGVTSFYGAYVWLPNGPTTVGGVRTFPQRYYVYEVLRNNVRMFVDVVDTYAAGNGFVRLGNGGAATNAVVQSTSTADVIKIRLFNTMPRNEDGSLTMPLASYDSDHQASNDLDVADDYLVYADAAKLSESSGAFIASPTSATINLRGGGTAIRTIGARNEYVSGSSGGTNVTFSKGVVRSFVYNGLATPNAPFNRVAWTYVPLEASGNVPTLDNGSATITGTGFTGSNLTGRFIGTDYLVSNLGATATGDVRYAPQLQVGDYDIYAYLSGDQGTELFGRNVVYEVREGNVLTNVVVDQSAGGWVRIGTRRFKNARYNRITVRVTNQSADSAADAGRKAFADAIRFVGATDQGVTSTPLNVNARIRKTSGTVAETSVVVVADERGVLHCLDAEGNPDGTTTEYWSYPSTPELGNSNWVDPNVRDGIDGTYEPLLGPSGQVVTAIMPAGFDLSSGLVQRINGEDFLYIASSNGRVYCIAMAGRGDYNTSQQTGAQTITPGSTKRAWTYPSDPKDDPATGVATSRLGPFAGSVAFKQTASGPTIFAPSSAGRMIALDAEGRSNRTTAVRWAYPAFNRPTLGSIVTTPLVDFDKVFFGTLKKDDNPGQFLALSADTGAVAWSRIGSTASDDFGDFRSSPTSAAGSLVSDARNLVFTLNDTGKLYAFSASDGALVWSTLDTDRPLVSRAGLGFTTISFQTTAGFQAGVPVVMATTQDGAVRAYYARPSQTASTGSRFAWGVRNQNGGEMTSSAFSNGWLYFGDADGLLYALADPSSGGSTVDDSQNPLSEQVADDSPKGTIYRKAKIKFITREAFRKLQSLPNAGRLTYLQSLASNFTPTISAYEWGQTAYVLAYDFPYVNQSTSGSQVVPPQVTLDLTIDGKVVRTAPAQTLKYGLVNDNNPPFFNAVPPTTVTDDDNPRMDAYAIAQFSLNNGGNNALPPGVGTISLAVRTSPSAGTGATDDIDLPGSTLPFTVANPLAVVIQRGSYTEGIGNTTNGADASNQVNGSPDVTGTSANENRLITSAGVVSDAQTGKARIFVIDRSLMTLIRPNGAGLDNIRVDLRDLAWQGGEAAIYKPLDNALYPSFEDKPTQFPNISLDYPDLSRSIIRVTKDPQGDAENPVSFRTSLLPPTLAGGGEINEDNYASRVLQPTPFDFDLDIPRYQPANSAAQIPAGQRVSDAGGNIVDQGYVGRIHVFVDSLENGLLDAINTKETYRSFNLATAVAVDQKIAVITPTIDLGSLAPGTGFSPLSPSSTATTQFNPWNGAWADAYRTFTARNEGNVNLLNVRVAKRGNAQNYDPSTGATFESPWRFYSGASDDYAWLNGGMNLWTNIDSRFAPIYGADINRVILPKPRVEDRIGTELAPNPIRRANANLGTTGVNSSTGLPDVLADPTIYPPGLANVPRLAVTIPIGFPVGKFSSQLKVIEDVNGNGGFDGREHWSLLPRPGNQPPAADTSQDQTFVATFNVREGRLTTAPTQKTAPMIEATSGPTGGSAAFPYANLQPSATRDPFGALLVAWTSNRPQYQVTTQPDSAKGRDDWRIYFGSVNNRSSFTASGVTTPNAEADRVPKTPLRDLNFFQPANNNGPWFRQTGPEAGYPSEPADALFGSGTVGGSAHYGAPSFVSSGFVNPYVAVGNGARLRNSTYLTFVGEAQKAAGAGRAVDSRVFIARVAQSNGGRFTIGAPVGLAADTSSVKGKASSVFTGVGDQALVFYSTVSGGVSSLSYAPFDGSQFGTARPLDLGRGFESASGPSAIGRLYQGARTDLGSRVVELAFSGKLRSRPSAEIFMGRLPLDDVTGLPRTDTATPFAYYPYQTSERLISAGPSVFRARGVIWNADVRARILLTQIGPDGERNILVDGVDTSGAYNAGQDTRRVDSQSGLLSYDTRLGGKVYIDPNLGTVRFANAAPSPATELRLSYQPLFLRMSAEQGGNGFTSPTVLFDNRLSAPDAMWRTGASGTINPNSTNVVNDRYLVFYNRGAAGATQAARPLSHTMRFGVRLPYPVYTEADGSVRALSVVNVDGGPISTFQIDPARGRVYFTAADEDRRVRVRYIAVNPATQQPFRVDDVFGTVSLVQETDVQEVPIEQAVNESNLSAFLDPFSFTSVDERRPPLVWLFWTSTRAGGSDIFFQTIAPRLSPVLP